MPTRPAAPTTPATARPVYPGHAANRTATPVERLDAGVVDAYLRRLGVGAAPPSAEELSRLHRAHVERMPYETFWIHLGQPWGTDAGESARRLAAGGRGGYCYQLNGAFSALLASLGYRVTRHVAGVHDATGPSEETLANHVALLAHDLPTDANPCGTWYVDAGLGDALHEPLPLVAGAHQQGPFGLSLAPVTGPDPVGDWHLGTDGTSSVTGVSLVTSVPVGMDAFAARHTFNATSPESGFAGFPTAQRRHATGCDIVRGCVFIRRTGATDAEVETSTFEDRGTWLAALADVFGVVLDAPADEVDALWSRARANHEAWVAAQAAEAADAAEAEAGEAAA
jgi:N-hydroxyarylamine O-acetyltransferase